METFSAMLPIQLPTPPRIFDELSGQIGKLARIALHEYMRDFWQRSVLFLDILRQRGNQREEMLAHGIGSVLIYDSELVMRGDQLPHPVNYSLLRIIPACGISQNDGAPRPRPGVLPSVLAATEAEICRLKGRIAEGNAVDAAARVLVYVGKAQHRVEESTFEALRKLLLAHPEVSEAEFNAAVREQWAILAIDERAAIEALPELLPTNATSRRDFSDFVQTTATATGKLNADGQRRLSKVLHLLTAGTSRNEPTRGTGKITAERTQPIH